MKFSAERNIPWDDRPYKVAIFNAEPTVTQLICVDQRQVIRLNNWSTVVYINMWLRFGNAVIYDWSTKEKKELSELIVGTPIGFHKNTIVTKTRDVMRVYMNDELVHQSSVEIEIQFVQMNDTLVRIQNKTITHTANYAFFSWSVLQCTIYGYSIDVIIMNISSSNMKIVSRCSYSMICSCTNTASVWLFTISMPVKY